MFKIQNNQHPFHHFLCIFRASIGPLVLFLIGGGLSVFFQQTGYAAGVVGNGSPGSCTETAFDNALVGGGTVSFNCGGAAKTIVIGSEKTITNDTTIDGGNSITLSGGKSTRLFFVKPATSLTLNNLTLANGYTTGQGGAVHSGSFNNTVLNVNHCNFTGNLSAQTGEAGGGAIYSGAGTLNIVNSTFTGNQASMGGAVRVLNSNLTINGSTFSNNKAVGASMGYGGAITIDGANGDGGKIVIRTSTFKDNAANTYGGALFNSIYNDNSTAITDSVFSGNAVGGTSKGQGGAVWSTGNPALGGHWVINANLTTLTVVNTAFTGNTSGQQGGGLWIARHPKGTVISRSTISGNTAFNSMGGGIVQSDQSQLSVLNSTISDNKASGAYSMGAGVYIGKNSKAMITNTTISNNTANWQGGGIFGALNVTLKNTILANNVALNGGNAWNIKHNCFEPMTDGGNNLQFPIPKDKPCAAGILIDDPKLGVLGNNGGLTQTRPLLSGSAASRNASGCPATDQRGVARAKPSGTNCDIGAFEAGF